MNRIVLFRYHKRPYVCRDRLKQLRQYNPGVKIYGLYGGEEADFDKFQSYLRKFLDGNYCIKGKSRNWKWKNSDLAIRLWFSEVGAKVEFDVLHVVEWDLLLFDSLEKIYKHIPTESLGITALTPLAGVAERWSWVSKEPYAAQTRLLFSFAKEKYKYSDEPYASLGPGTSLPRKFLSSLANVVVPEYGHDELRLPLFAQILGFKMKATGFYGEWGNPNVQRYFNCHGDEISLDMISEELNIDEGRRVFHPYRKRLI